MSTTVCYAQPFGDFVDFGATHASQLWTDTGEFDGILTASDTTVQKALETIDFSIASPTSVLNTTYLKLDASNDPLTGSLEGTDFTATGTVQAEQLTSTDDANVTDLITTGDLTCTNCIDISGETNLAVTANEIVLTDDTLSIHADIARDSELHNAVTLAGTPNYLTLSTQEITMTVLDISDDTNLAVSGTLLNLTGDTLSVNEGTLTDEKLCEYEATGTQIECTQDNNSTNWDTAYTHSQDNSQAHTDYMLNTGDIATGVYDFGGATTFEIPNSADPDLGVEGQISWDSDDDWLRGHEGTNQVILSTGKVFITRTITKPLDLDEADTLPIWQNKTGATLNITAVYSNSDTDDVVYTLKETSAYDFTSLTTIEAITIATNGTGVFYNELTTGIDHTTIETGNVIVFDNDAADDPNYLSFTIVGWLNSDVP